MFGKMLLSVLPTTSLSCVVVASTSLVVLHRAPSLKFGSLVKRARSGSILLRRRVLLSLLLLLLLLSVVVMVVDRGRMMEVLMRLDAGVINPCGVLEIETVNKLY